MGIRYRIKLGGRVVVEGEALSRDELEIARALTRLVSEGSGVELVFEVIGGEAE